MIGALVKVDDSEVISFLLNTEIIPLCLSIMGTGKEQAPNVGTGKELSQTVATFIIQKILVDDMGLNYVCQTYERFDTVSTVLSKMVKERPSTRLLKHIVRCYLRLSDNQKACEALRHKLPDQLKDNTFKEVLRDDQHTAHFLNKLIFQVQEAGNVQNAPNNPSNPNANNPNNPPNQNSNQHNSNNMQQQPGPGPHHSQHGPNPNMPPNVSQHNLHQGPPPGHVNQLPQGMQNGPPGNVNAALAHGQHPQQHMNSHHLAGPVPHHHQHQGMNQGNVHVAQHQQTHQTHQHHVSQGPSHQHMPRGLNQHQHNQHHGNGQHHAQHPQHSGHPQQQNIYRPYPSR